MPYFAVRSGDVFQCVLAGDATSACVTAVTQHCQENESCQPGLAFEIAEFGKPNRENFIILSDEIQKAGGFVDVEE